MGGSQRWHPARRHCNPTDPVNIGEPHLPSNDLAMSAEPEAARREGTPSVPALSIPQKRVLDDGHTPTISSPLNPDVKAADTDDAQLQRFKSARTKKESFKKRESKGTDSSRATPEPQPKRKAGLKAHNTQTENSPLRYKLAPPKPADFEPPRGPVLTTQSVAMTGGGEEIEFFETSDHVFNKKNFRYIPCIADPLFPSMFYYRQTEPEPYGPRMSYEDTAANVYFDATGRQVTTDKGFRMARANVAVREGRWYWECKIKCGIRPPKEENGKPEGGRHVRMGWARREASLDAPVGFDAYSYGIRDVSGEKVFMSRPKDFFPPGETIQEGDVIGLEIQLPSERLHRNVMSGNYNPAVDPHEENQPNRTAEAPNVVRDRLPIRFKAHTYFEKIEYHSTKELEDLMNPSPAGPGGGNELPDPFNPSPALRTLPNSAIRIYKNGKLMGTAFEDLLGFLPPASKPAPQVGAREGMDDGMLGYYPAISIFRGGAAEVNFGPDFWYPPPGYANTGGDDVDMDAAEEDSETPLAKIRAVSERYHDQIVEDIVYDIVDEVDFWMQDGGGSTGRAGVAEKSGEVAMAPGRAEIKELVQED